MKKILIFYTPIIEEIDKYSRIFHSLIETNITNQIFVVECKDGGHLNNCISNYNGDSYKCYLCSLKRDRLFKNFKNISFLNYPEIEYENYLITNYDELKSFTYRKINIGLGIHSALISILKNHRYDILTNNILLNKVMKTSKKTIDLLYQNLSSNFDEIYVFNGRASHYNAVVEFCKYFEIKYKIFEIVADNNKYLLNTNSSVHDIETFNNDLNRHWDIEKPSKREKIGKLFFNIKKLEEVKFIKYNNYSSFQQKGKLPDELSRLNSYITIFGSSKNEYQSVKGWKNNFSSGDDEEIVREICEKFSDLNFIYRAHPNLKLIKNKQTFDIEKLKDIPNLRVFDQYSKISTYDLIKFSDKIIVFKSTIGVEANYFGKPVISIGPNWYQYLDIAYKPKNIEELKKILYTKSLKSKLKEDSIKYGYYILTRGKELNKN